MLILINLVILEYERAICVCSGFIRVFNGKAYMNIPTSDSYQRLAVLQFCKWSEKDLVNKQSVLGYVFEGRLPFLLSSYRTFKVLVGTNIMEFGIGSVQPLQDDVSEDVLYRINYKDKETPGIDFIFCGKPSVLLMEVTVTKGESANKSKVYESICNLHKAAVLNVTAKYSNLKPANAIYVYINPTLSNFDFLNEQLEQAMKRREGLTLSKSPIPLFCRVFCESTEFLVKGFYADCCYFVIVRFVLMN